ncbi:MAG: tetratricopeptide repeat protein, partial [Saprospiraceae bacterium]|nr:tetratricopeptide repeat protein [Saprospiraceae bacterium]
MRTILLLPVFFLSSFIAIAQNADSTVIKQVDSLIQESRALTGQQKFDKALEVNAIAERIALENFDQASAAYGSVCFNRGRVLYFKGDYPEAEKWYQESITIRSRALGKEHSDYAASLNN